jgi:hypothetical protein
MTENGISASEALHITEWIGRSLQEQSDDLTTASEAVQKDKIAIEQRARLENWAEERFWEEARKQEAVTHHTERLATGIQNFLKVGLDDIECEFGMDRAKAFWRLFISKRGEGAKLTYLTERNTAEERPLFELEPGVASCPLINALYFAVFNAGEQQLRESYEKEAFLRARDRALENEVKQTLQAFFPGDAQFLPNVYETADSHHEHDLLVLWNQVLFVIESKASPPVEPFRDPDKAFTRISHAFRSDRGIQKGYEQANRIRKLVTSGKVLDLYDTKGRVACSVAKSQISSVYLIVVTRDNFGVLATDLSLLLEKPDNEDYPWVPNILDLQALLDAWRHFKWGPEKLCEYLDDRIRLHRKVFASDELDVAGYFIRHGNFRQLLETEADRIVLEPHYSDVFDQIYMTRYGAPEVKYAPVAPVLTDARQMLGLEPTPNNITNKGLFHRRKKNRPSKAYKNKIGRGARCPCNSGKTYARCHGRKK